jgi:hypothetical protein
MRHHAANGRKNMITVKRNKCSVTVNGVRCLSPSNVMDQLLSAGMKFEKARMVIDMVRRMDVGSKTTIVSF